MVYFFQGCDSGSNRVPAQDLGLALRCPAPPFMDLQRVSVLSCMPPAKHMAGAPGRNSRQRPGESSADTRKKYEDADSASATAGRLVTAKVSDHCAAACDASSGLYC